VTTLIIGLLILVVTAACSSTSTVEQVDEDFPTAQPTAAEQTENEPAEASEDESDATPDDEPESGSESDSETEPLTDTATTTDTATITSTDTTTNTAANEPATEPTAAPAATAPPPTAEPTAAPTEPVALKSGEFTFIDDAHNATGTATLYQLPDGSRILRFENFQVADAPGVYVLLAVNPQPRNDSELFDQGQVELGELTALSGNQNYEIPADLDLDEYNSVVLYCRPYTTIMSTAALETATP
jgi:hypothetical protein